MKDRDNYWIKRLKTLTPSALNQELNQLHGTAYLFRLLLFLFSASNNVTSILEITKTTYPLRSATTETSLEIYCIFSIFPILHCLICLSISISIYLYVFDMYTYTYMHIYILYILYIYIYVNIYMYVYIIYIYIYIYIYLCIV